MPRNGDVHRRCTYTFVNTEEKKSRQNTFVDSPKNNNVKPHARRSIVELVGTQSREEIATMNENIADRYGRPQSMVSAVSVTYLSKAKCMNKFHQMKQNPTWLERGYLYARGRALVLDVSSLIKNTSFCCPENCPFCTADRFRFSRRTPHVHIFIHAKWTFGTTNVRWRIPFAVFECRLSTHAFTKRIDIWQRLARDQYVQTTITPKPEPLRRSPATVSEVPMNRLGLNRVTYYMLLALVCENGGTSLRGLSVSSGWRPSHPQNNWLNFLHCEVQLILLFQSSAAKLVSFWQNICLKN